MDKDLAGKTSHFVKAVCPLHVSSPPDGSTVEVSL